MMDEINSDFNIELPRYLKLLNNFMLVGILIPVCCWLFFVFYFKQLSPVDYKYVLNFIQYSVMLLVAPLLLIAVLLVLILKSFDTEVTDDSEFLPVKKMYAILLHTSSVKRILIWLLVYIRLSLPFFLGWIVFGGIISFFATASHS